MIYNTSRNGYEFIKSFEGCSLTPYTCPSGYKTIGYGHVLKSHDNIEQIDKEQAELLLQSDIEACEAAVLRLINVPLFQHQFDMLVSFTFNLGAGALQRSALRSKINRSEHDAVPDELERWVYGGGVVLPGLIRRRIAEGNVYSRGYNIA